MNTRFNNPFYTAFASAILLSTWLCAALQAQEVPVPSLAERLGYGPDARLLIVHADDIGLSHSVNAASFEALESGAVSSGSIMVPCPWFPEAAEMARENPELDLGLHLTLTAEWKNFRWDSVLPRNEAPSLHDEHGFLHASGEAMASVDPAEAEREIRAQVERALAFGIQPTHLDSHMGTLYANAALFDALIRVARDYNLPVFLPRSVFAQAPQMAASLPEDLIPIDRFFMAPGGLQAHEWEDFYSRILSTLEPGVTQIIVHLAYDDPEMQAVTVDHPDFGSAWRQRDFDFFSSPAFDRLLEEHDIKLITWREIGALMAK